MDSGHPRPRPCRRKAPGIAFIRRSGVGLDDVHNGLRRARLRRSSESGRLRHHSSSFEQRRLGGDSNCELCRCDPHCADAHFGKEAAAARDRRTACHCDPGARHGRRSDAHHERQWRARCLRSRRWPGLSQADRRAGQSGLREATGTPERFVLDFACARHDRAFRATFARFSPAQRLRCESVDKSESGQATTIERLQGLLRPAEALRVRTEDVDLSTVPCAWCAAPSGWTLCANCKTLICGARSFGRTFSCRDSCGAQFQTAPLDALDAARQGATATQLAIGHSQTLLPGKGPRK